MRGKEFSLIFIKTWYDAAKRRGCPQKQKRRKADRSEEMTKIGNAIAARRAELGLNQTELANAAGMSQKNISKLELGQTAKPQNWRMLAKALKMDETEFAKLIDESAMQLGRPGKRATAIPRNVSARVREINAPYFGVNKRVPIMGRAAAGAPGKLVMMGTEYDTIETPPELAGVDGAYAVYVYGDSMEPRYFNGELLMVNPYVPVGRGDFCIVQIGSDGDECGYVKRFVSQDGEHLVVTQMNPAEDLVFDSADVQAVHKVVGMRTR